MTNPIDPSEIAMFITDDPDVFNEADWGWAARGEAPPKKVKKRKMTSKEKRERKAKWESERDSASINWNADFDVADELLAKQHLANASRKENNGNEETAIVNTRKKSISPRR